MTSFRAAPVALALAAVGVVALAPASSSAHFHLQAPPANFNQDVQGNPQKASPCGDDGTATETGMVTTYQAGQTVTITLDETVFHPGHYRVAIGKTGPGDLPDEPPVTPGGGSACGSAPIMDPPVFPVIADGVLEHDSAFGGQQTFEVTLPDDLECDNCTLQVLEFMSNHGAPCYYHHCATIKVQLEPVVTAAASTTGAGGAGTSAGGGSGTGTPTTSVGGAGSGATSVGPGPAQAEPTASDDGCACSAVGSSQGDSALLGLAGLVGLVAVARRRRVVAAR